MRNQSTAHPAFPIPKTLNLFIVVAQLVALLGLFILTAWATKWWQLSLLAIAFGVLGNSVYSIIHEAEHNMLHPVAKVNDLVGILMALFFPAPFHLIRQGHIGHHQRNRSDDEAFDLYFEGESPLLRSLQLYSILIGLYWCAVALSNVVVLVCPFVLQRRFFEFNRPSAALMESLNPKYWRIIRLEALMAITLHFAIVSLLEIPIGNYLCVYFGFAFSWSAMQYVHHFGAGRDVLNGARNLRFLSLIDLIWLHHNWHLVHHRQPMVPWIHLPRLGRDDAQPREFMLWHYLRMWRGPRLTKEHVENKYAGRVIR